MSQTITQAQSIGRATERSVLVEALIGLSGLAVLLQGLWAGIFLQHDGQRDAASGWIDVHARGGEVALLLTVIVTVVTFVRVRARRGLWPGWIVVPVLLAVEAYLGGLVRADGHGPLNRADVPP